MAMLNNQMVVGINEAILDDFRRQLMGNKLGHSTAIPMIFTIHPWKILKDQGTGGPPGLKIGSLKPPSGAAISPQKRSHQLVVNHRQRWTTVISTTASTVATTSHHLPKQNKDLSVL